MLIGAGLLVLGVPLALPLAALTFLGGFVPIVGAFVAGVLAVLVALVSNGLTTALIVLVIVVAVQQVEGNVLQPMLQSRGLRLHAAVVLLVVTRAARSTASRARSSRCRSPPLWPSSCATWAKSSTRARRRP